MKEIGKELKFNLKISNEPHRKGSSLYFFAEDGENIIIADPVSLSFNKDNAFHFTQCISTQPTMDFMHPLEVISDFESSEFRSLRTRNEELATENNRLRECIKTLIGK